MQVIEHGSGALHRVKDRRKLALLEGAIGSRLVHPNIVTTYGYYTGLVPTSKLTLPHLRTRSDDAAPPRDVTLVLQEFCSGGSLRVALDNGSLTPDQGSSPGEVGSEPKGFERFRVVAHIASQVAAALVSAHSCGVMHCDVKTENILLRELPEDACFPGACAFCIEGI